MKKRFNVTGLCLPDRHYIADISERLEEMKTYVDEGDYFTVNRARQYGKTTTLNALKRRLKAEYTVFLISFEGIGEEVFQTQGFSAYVWQACFMIRWNLVKCQGYRKISGKNYTKEVLGILRK